MSCAHIDVVREFFSNISAGKQVGNFTMLILPVICACVVQYFVLIKAKRPAVGFVPAIMVFLTSVVAEIFYNGLIPIGGDISGATGEIIGSVYAAAALLCYVGLLIGVAVWFAAKKISGRKNGR